MKRAPYIFLTAWLLATISPAKAFESGGAGGLPELPSLSLMPSAQFAQPSLSLIPKGALADDPWEWPVVLGQFFTASAINFGAAILFNHLSDPGEASIEEARRQLLKWGIVQFATTPLVSATGVWAMGSLSPVHDVGYGWPLVANYGAQLILVAMKVGLGYGLGNFQGGDSVRSLRDVFGAYLVVDMILHGLLIPMTVTYFSIKSRGPKSLGFASRAPLSPVALEPPPPLRAAADVRERRSHEAAVPVFAMPLASLRF